jgi:hypothetical protein
MRKLDNLRYFAERVGWILIVPWLSVYPLTANADDGSCDLVPLDSFEGRVGMRHNRIEHLIRWGEGLAVELVRSVKIKRPDDYPSDIVKEMWIERLRSNPDTAVCRSGTDYKKRYFLVCGQGVPGRDLTLGVGFNPKFGGNPSEQMSILLRYLLERVINCPSEERKKRFG